MYVWIYWLILFMNDWIKSSIKKRKKKTMLLWCLQTVYTFIHEVRFCHILTFNCPLSMKPLWFVSYFLHNCNDTHKKSNNHQLIKTLKGYDRGVCDIENAIQFMFASPTLSHTIPITLQAAESPNFLRAYILCDFQARKQN